MKIVRGVDIRLDGEITAGDMRSALAPIPENTPIQPHLEGPHGVVTLSAQWDADLAAFPPAEPEPDSVRVHPIGRTHAGRRDFIISIQPGSNGMLMVTPDLLRQWANRRAEIIWVSNLLDNLAEAMEDDITTSEGEE